MIPARLIISSAVMLVYSIGHLRKENKALAEGNRLLYSALTTRSEQLQYMANLLDQHGIEIDEFDMIVLTQQF